MYKGLASLLIALLALLLGACTCLVYNIEGLPYHLCEGLGIEIPAFAPGTDPLQCDVQERTFTCLGCTYLQQNGDFANDLAGWTLDGDAYFISSPSIPTPPPCAGSQYLAFSDISTLTQVVDLEGVPLLAEYPRDEVHIKARALVSLQASPLSNRFWVGAFTGDSGNHQVGMTPLAEAEQRTTQDNAWEELTLEFPLPEEADYLVLEVSGERGVSMDALRLALAPPIARSTYDLALDAYFQQLPGQPVPEEVFFPFAILNEAAPFEYVITVENQDNGLSGTAEDIVILDGFSTVEINGVLSLVDYATVGREDQSYNPTTGHWNVGALEPGEQKQLYIRYHIDQMENAAESIQADPRFLTGLSGDVNALNNIVISIQPETEPPSPGNPLIVEGAHAMIFSLFPLLALSTTTDQVSQRSLCVSDSDCRTVFFVNRDTVFELDIVIPRANFDFQITVPGRPDIKIARTTSGEARIEDDAHQIEIQQVLGPGLRILSAEPSTGTYDASTGLWYLRRGDAVPASLRLRLMLEQASFIEAAMTYVRDHTVRYIVNQHISLLFNVPPVATDDRVYVYENGHNCLHVTNNDYDPLVGGELLSNVEIVEPPDGGLTLGFDCERNGIRANNVTGFSGLDSFLYRVYDDQGLPSNVAQVTVIRGIPEELKIIHDMPDMMLYPDLIIPFPSPSFLFEPHTGGWRKSSECFTTTITSSNEGVATISSPPAFPYLYTHAAGTTTFELTLTVMENSHSLPGCPDLPIGNTETISFEVTVLEPPGANLTPVFRTLGPQRLVLGAPSQTLPLGAYARDPEGEPLVYRAASSDPSHVRIRVEDNLLTLIPVDVGTASVTVTARDPAGAEMARTFAVTVDLSNAPPRVTNPLDDLTLIAQNPAFAANLTDLFSDADGDALAFSVLAALNEGVEVTVLGNDLIIEPLAPTGGPVAVTVTAADPFGLSTFFTFNVTVLPDPDAYDLALTKTGQAQGNEAIYEVVVENQGPGTAREVVVLDELGADIDLTGGELRTSQGSYTLATGQWTVGDLAPGASASFLIRGFIEGTHTNTATLTGGLLQDTNPDNNSATAMVEGGSAPYDLSIEEGGGIFGNPTFYPDDIFGPIVSVVHTGDAPATDVKAQVDLSAGGAYLEHTISPSQGTFNPATGVWDIGTIGVGEVVRLQFSARATYAAGAHVFRASLTDGLAGDTNPTNDTVTALFDVLDTTYDIAVQPMSFIPGAPLEDEAFDVRITARNNGPDFVRRVEIQAPVPAGITYVTHGAANATYDPATGLLTMVLGPNQLGVMTLRAFAATPGDYTFTADLTYAPNDTNGSNNSVSATVTVQEASASQE